jgi:drug/metabolite transporter (DMT)-like permease
MFGVVRRSTAPILRRMAQTAPSSSRAPGASVLAAIVIVIAAWASAFVVIRGIGPHFSGGGLALARLLVGTALLALGLIGRPWVKPTAREWLLLFGYGAAWFGGYNVALNIAEHTLDAGTAAMLVNTGPILIALGAGVFLGEKINRWLALGAAVAFGGAVLIAAGSGTFSLQQGPGVL